MKIGQFFIDLLNGIIKGVGAAIVWALSLLPDSPFQQPDDVPDSVNLGWITWLFDFPTWIQHLTLILTAIGIYYACRVILRWIKIARD